MSFIFNIWGGLSQFQSFIINFPYFICGLNVSLLTFIRSSTSETHVKKKKQEDSFLLKIVLNKWKDNKLIKEGLQIYFIFYITVQFKNLCKTENN